MTGGTWTLVGSGGSPEFTQSPELMCTVYVGTAITRTKALDSWEIVIAFPYMGQT